VAQHVDRRRLAVRPRHPGQTRDVGRTAERGGGGERGRATRVADDEHRKVSPFGLLHDRRGRPTARGGLEIVVPVALGAAHRDEQGAADDATAVVGDVG
jgi:hypothetical protein